MSKLREAREAMGLSQAEFAAQIGVAQTTLSALERGTRQMTRSVLEQIGRVTGRTPEELGFEVGCEMRVTIKRITP